MIDEEDDEEILTKRVSLKTILKTIFVILLILLGAVIIYVGIFPGDQILNFIIGFTLICVGTTIIQYQTEPAEPNRQTLTILKCSLCGLTKVRNHKQGDFVYKKMDNCDKCNDIMQINQIYSVKLKTQTKKEKKQELLTQKSSKK
ncbi:MAG: hypothetical protein ACFFBP_03885 [Promethearchaeota archaeon]